LFSLLGLCQRSTTAVCRDTANPACITMLHSHHACRRPAELGAAFSIALAVLLLAEVSAAQTPAGPLTRERAVELALMHNQSLRASRLAVDQARADEITAALKPNPVFTSTNADFPVFTPRQLTLSNLANTQSFTQALSYVVERGGKREQRVQVARDTTEMTARTVEDAERQVRFQVGQAFVNVLLAKSTLAFAQDDLKEFTQVVDLNKQRVASGDLAQADYLRIALQKLQFEQDVTAAQVALIQGKAALRQLVGYDTVPEDFDVAGELSHRQAVVTLESLQRDAIAARPDLLAARANTRLAGSTVELARANRARDLTLETEYDRNGPVNGVGVGLAFEIPIHDRNQGEIARSKAAASQALESAESVRFGVLTDVRSAYAGYQTADVVASLYESGYLNQASQSREISNYAYQRGAASLLDLLDAERSYRATQLAYRQALAAYMTGTEQINFVVGKKVMQ